MSPHYFLSMHARALDAERTAVEAFKEAYPVGASVPYEWTAKRRVGTIEKHGYNGDAWVITDRGTRVKINAANVYRTLSPRN